MWVILSLFSALFSGTAWVLAKGASSADATGAIALRSISLLLFTLVYIGLFGSFNEFIAIDKTALWSAVGAGLTASVGLVCYQQLIRHGLGRGAMLEKLSIVVIAGVEWLLFGVKWSFVGVIGLIFIVLGIVWMCLGKSTEVDKSRGMNDLWLIVGTVAFTAASSVLAKLAVGAVSAEIALCYRTGVVMLAVVIWLIATRSLGCIRRIASAQRGLLVASGVSAGVAWLCYYFALSGGSASAVHGIDKMSVLVTSASGSIFFGERYSWRMKLGISGMVAGILLWTLASYS